MTTPIRLSSRRITALLAHRGFFWFVLGLLAVQAAWIALSGRYPMAFDEDFHLGIIRLYAHHSLPFWSGQPAGADAYGAVARDPSYLYHYLMSFPYRLLQGLGLSHMAQIISLRAINIGLFTYGLVLWREVLRKSGASAALINACMLLFVLLPAVPLLAAQINYDNLFVPAVAIVLLLTLKLDEAMRRYKILQTRWLLVLLIVCLLTSLVKYAFLPIFVGVACYLLIRFVRTYGSWRAFLVNLVFGATLIERRSRWLLLTALVLASGLCVERYGVNLVRYHTPIPDCGQVLTVRQCSAYGPWIRDYNYALNKVAAGHNPLAYMDDWFYGMWLRLFFAVDGPTTGFQTRGPFVIPAIGAIVFAVSGMLAVILSRRKLLSGLQANWLGLCVLITGWYVGALWLEEYKAYVHTGHPVAINGRYLIPVLLPLMVVLASGISYQLRRWQTARVTLAIVAFACLLWGGGACTYILRSNPAWYWPDSGLGAANAALQRTRRTIGAWA